MKHIKLFEEFTNEKTITIDWNDDENSLIFSDAGLIKVDYDGEFKYRNKWFSTAEHEGPEDLIKDLTKAFKADKFVYVNESLSKSEIDQTEKYLDKYVDEDALFDMCNDFYVEDEEWQDVKNDLDKADLISWALSYIKSNNLKLKDIKSIFESAVNEAKILTRDEMMNTMRTKYGLNFVKKSEEFDGEKDGIWLGGTDPLMPNAKDAMFNYYHGGSKYPQGVHKDLAKFLDKCGWYSQFADPGTVMLWPKN